MNKKTIDEVWVKSRNCLIQNLLSYVIESVI